jgi:hypothetical protein
MSQNTIVASSVVFSLKNGNLKCFQCQYSNDDDAKYCIICGNRLTTIEEGLSEEEEKDIRASWNQINSNKAKEFQSVDEYIDSIDK